MRTSNSVSKSYILVWVPTFFFTEISLYSWFVQFHLLPLIFWGVFNFVSSPTRTVVQLLYKKQIVNRKNFVIKWVLSICTTEVNFREAGLVLPFSHNLSVRLFCLENSSHNRPIAIKAARILDNIYRVFWKTAWSAPNRFKRVPHQIDSVACRNYRRNYDIKESYLFSPGDFAPTSPSWNKLW